MDQRRLNVACTRAKRFLAIVCDTETITSSEDSLQSLIEHFNTSALFRSVLVDYAEVKQEFAGITNNALKPQSISLSYKQKT